MANDETTYIKQKVDKEQFVKKTDLQAGLVDKSAAVKDLLINNNAWEGNVHTLTRDVVGSVGRSVKNEPKNAVLFVKDSIKNGIDDLVVDSEGEETEEALALLAGQKERELRDKVKKIKNRAAAPKNAIGGIVTTPEKIGNFRANWKERSASKNFVKGNKAYRKSKKTNNLDKANKEIDKAKKKLAKADKKFAKANKLRKKKRPIAWFFDGRGSAFFKKVAIGAIAGVVVISILTAAFVSIFSAIVGNQNKGYGDLDGNCLIICKYLREKGVPDMTIAAICGNICGESSYEPAAVNEIGASGMCQWYQGRCSNLKTFAKSKGKNWTDINVQCEFLWNECLSNKKAAFENTKAETKVEDATIIWCEQFEIPYVKNHDKDWDQYYQEAHRGHIRESEAKRVYEQLQSGDGFVNDGALDSKQQAIIDACKSVSSPGKGYCAVWVSFVYAAAGCGYPTGQQGPPNSPGNWYDKYCHSSNKSDLKPGMIIAVPSNNQGSDGQTYGHVGIYVGNNKVMDNVGYIRTINLDDWIKENNTYYTPKWGFAW